MAASSLAVASVSPRGRVWWTVNDGEYLGVGEVIGGDWTEELLVVLDPDATLHEWCERMALAAGVPAEPIWQWAYIERVSTGLFMTKLGESHGAKMLDVAYRLFAA